MSVTLEIVLGVILSIIAIVLMITMIKSGHWFKAILTTSFSGFAALLAVNLFGSISQVVIPINWYTIAVSGILGAPGTIFTLGVMATFLQ